MHGTNRVVARLFGRVAASYDQAGFFQQIAQRLVAHAGVGSGMRVLDVACGTDAERPGLQPASFDVVIVASAVYLLGEPAAALRGLWALLRPGGRLAVSDFNDLDARWAWKDALLGRLAPPLEPLGGGRLGAAGLERLLRATGVGQVTIAVERLDVAYADAPVWWAEQWTHGERRALERMDDRAVAAYQATAFAAIEACREADGAIHWRPEIVYAIAGS